jgi:hypothetical protein
MRIARLLSSFIFASENCENDKCSIELHQQWRMFERTGRRQALLAQSGHHTAASRQGARQAVVRGRRGGGESRVAGMPRWSSTRPLTMAWKAWEVCMGGCPCIRAVHAWAHTHCNTHGTGTSQHIDACICSQNIYGCIYLHAWSLHIMCLRSLYRFVSRAMQGSWHVM